MIDEVAFWQRAIFTNEIAVLYSAGQQHQTLAARITQPVTDLTQAVNTLASGQRDIRVNITSGDELEILGGAFNNMVAELKDSYERLEAMNRTLAKTAHKNAQTARALVELVCSTACDDSLAQLPPATRLEFTEAFCD